MALTDNDPTTYWESESGSETHFIRLYMKPGVIIDKLFICVDRTDDTYMPSKVLVSVGDTLADLDQINEVDVDLNFTGDVSYSPLFSFSENFEIKFHFLGLYIRVSR